MPRIHRAPRIASFAALTAIILLLAAITQARGRVIADTEDPVTESTETILRYLPDSGLALPATLASERDVYVFINSGGAFTSVKVLGLANASPSKLAGVLDGALKGSSDIAYSSGVHYVGAKAVVQRGRFGRTRSAMEVPIAAIVEGYRSSGFTPHVLLRVRRSAQIEGAAPVRYSRGRYNWYGLKDLPRDRPVVVTSSLPWWQLVAILLIVALPSLNVVLMLAGRIHGWWLRRSDANARAQMEANAKYGCVSLLLILAGLPVVFAVNITGMERVSDLWFGEPFSVLAVLAGSVPLLLCGMMVSVGNRQNYDIQGVSPKIEPEPATPEEAAARKRRQRIKRIPGIVGWALLFTSIFFVPSGTPRNACRIIAFLLIIFGDSIASALLRRFERPRPDIGSPG